MKKSLIIFTIIASFCFISCSNSTKKSENKVKETAYFKDNNIHVYYFHYSIRCEGCIAVEEKTKFVLEQIYPNKMKRGEIIFQSFNMDKNEDNGLSKKLKVGGQTLLFIKDDKIIDLTNDAFMYAAYSPDKYKTIVENTINELLK